MTQQRAWMLYGAYGTTGRLILDAALRRGLRPVLSGRDPARLSAIAKRHRLEAVPLALDGAGAEAPLGDVSAVVNAAGPFFETGRPLRELCLRAGVSYLDVNGEIGDFLDSIACDTRARQEGIAVIPGAGFGVVFGEALAAHVSRRMPDATWMRMSLAPANESSSAGAARSSAAVLAEGGYAISGGELRERRIAFNTWRLSSEGRSGPVLRFAAAPRAELVAAHRLTGIPEIVAGIPLSLPAALALRTCGKLIGAILSKRSWTRRPAHEAASPDAHSDLRSRVWVEAGNGSGEKVMSVLETGEGYRLAACAAVRALENVLTTQPVGALTPVQAFGIDFVLSLPATHIEDLPVECAHG